MPDKYDKKFIAFEIIQTARDIKFCGNSLLVAKNIPCVTKKDRILLDKFLSLKHTCSLKEKSDLELLGIKIAQS